VGSFRRGLIIGFGFGYVKGSKAGRERYEQIQRNWNKVKANPAYQRLSAKAGALVGLGLQRGKLVALDNIERASHRVKNKVTGSRNGTDSY